jgi:hypothetical protein
MPMLYQQVTLTNKPQKISNLYARQLKVIHGTIPHAIPSPAWGIDPGVNFGLTVIEQDHVYVFHGALSKESIPGCYGLVAYNFLQEIAKSLNYIGAKLVIEGAAYGAPFRQVELSEIRTGFYLASSTAPLYMQTHIVPPATIRKEVFGNGKTQAMNEWPTLNHNAADALAMALYAAQL